MVDQSNNQNIQVGSGLASQLLNANDTTPQDMTPENIRLIAQELVKSTDPEKAEIGKNLMELPADTFDLFESEKKLKSLLEFLSQKGVSVDSAAVLFERAITIATEKAQTNILEVMGDKSKRAFEDLNSFGPNVLQKIYLMDTVAKKLMGSTYDQEYDKALDQVVELMSTMFETEEKDIQRISKLSDEQAKEINNLYASGKFEDAMNLIYDYTK